MTNPAWFPVQALVESCRSGAAGNISLGLALGYLSTTLPIVILAATIYFSNRMLGFYGVSLTGLGMLANLPILLAIDSFSPIAKNAAAMVRMAQLGEESI